MRADSKPKTTRGVTLLFNLTGEELAELITGMSSLNEISDLPGGLVDIDGTEWKVQSCTQFGDAGKNAYRLTLLPRGALPPPPRQTDAVPPEYR